MAKIRRQEERRIKKEEGRKAEHQMYGMFSECPGRRSIRRCKGAVIGPGRKIGRGMTSGPPSRPEIDSSGRHHLIY